MSHSLHGKKPEDKLSSFSLRKSEMPEKRQTLESRLITVQQASRYLGVSVSTLYGWVWQRRISFVKLGRALRFDLGDLDRFIEANRTRPRSTAGFSSE